MQQQTHVINVSTFQTLNRSKCSPLLQFIPHLVDKKRCKIGYCIHIIITSSNCV